MPRRLIAARANSIITKFLLLVAITQIAILAPAQETAARDEILFLKKPPAPNEQQESPLVFWREVWREPRPVVFCFLRIDLRDPRYEIFTLISDDPDGKGPAEARLVAPLALAGRHRAVAAINANAFRAASTILNKLTPYFNEGRPVDIAGLAVSDGAERSGSESKLEAFWLDGQRRPRVGNPNADTNATTVSQAVSNWISGLLSDGKNVALVSETCHPRSLVGVDATGRWLLLATADGRQKDYSEGITLREAAETMRAHGCRDATNLDGGGSSILLASDGEELRIMNRPSGGAPRPIPVMLGVRRAAAKASVSQK